MSVVKVPRLIFHLICCFRELTAKGKDTNNKDPKSELGYRLSVQVDPHNPARPLAVMHVPSLGNKVGKTPNIQRVLLMKPLSVRNAKLPIGLLDRNYYRWNGC